MIRKEIKVDGRLVPFKASAAIPRLYRLKVGRDIIGDMQYVAASLEKNRDNDVSIPMDALTMFENMAFIMAKHADPEITDSPDEWLEEFDTLSIYEIFPQILELWGLNTATTSESKKKLDQLSGK